MRRIENAKRCVRKILENHIDFRLPHSVTTYLEPEFVHSRLAAHARGKFNRTSEFGAGGNFTKSFIEVKFLNIPIKRKSKGEA